MYRRTPRRQLPIHFCCSMYRLATKRRKFDKTGCRRRIRCKQTTKRQCVTSPVPHVQSSRRFGSAVIPYIIRSTIGLLSDSCALVLLMGLGSFCLSCYCVHSVGGMARRGINTADLWWTSYSRRYALHCHSSWCQGVEPAGTWCHLGRPGSIQVHREHLTCQVKGRHASCQRSVGLYVLVYYTWVVSRALVS